MLSNKLGPIVKGGPLFRDVHIPFTMKGVICNFVLSNYYKRTLLLSGCTLPRIEGEKRLPLFRGKPSER